MPVSVQLKVEAVVSHSASLHFGPSSAAENANTAAPTSPSLGISRRSLSPTSGRSTLAERLSSSASRTLLREKAGRFRLFDERMKRGVVAEAERDSSIRS